MKSIFALFVSVALFLSATAPRALDVVLLSDTFDDGTVGAYLDGQPLNNGLGGSVSATWEDPGKYATYRQIGTNMVADVSRGPWDVYNFLTSYEVDPTKTYAVEFVQYLPEGTLDPDYWNPHGGVVVMARDQHMAGGGLVIRLQGLDASGWDPAYFSLVYYNGERFFPNPPIFTGNFELEDFNSDGALPVRLEFTGAGTPESPLNGRLFLNGNFKGSFSIDDMVNAGRKVGFVTQTGQRPPGADHGWTDNFVLSEVVLPPTVEILAGTFPYFLPHNQVPLDAIVLKAGLTEDPSLEVTWSQVSGPATVTFGDIHAIQTDVTLPAVGYYTLKLEARDGTLIGSDTVELVLAEAPGETVILSDNFDGGTAGNNIGGRTLNNALGGSLSATWADTLAMAKYGLDGSDLVCHLGPVTTWDEVKFTCTFEADPNKLYALETRIKPATGVDGIYNRACGPVLYSQNDQRFQQSGLNFRFSGPADNEEAPNSVNLVDINGTRVTGWTWSSLVVGADDPRIDPLNDYDDNGYLPIRIEFTGTGTPDNPAEGRVYINGNWKCDFVADDLGNPGRRFGYQTTQLSSSNPLVIGDVVVSELNVDLPNAARHWSVLQ
ncbi:MAG TPA: hypothetical protein PK847_11435 [Candidatus Sumerlaeota bacterium]|nr:hypothetical protein [Candidatus Sumerlaeota bacterium]